MILIFILLAPFIYLYENHYMRVEKYRLHLKFLRERGVKLKNVEKRLHDDNIDLNKIDEETQAPHARGS